MKRIHYSKQRELILDYFNNTIGASSGEEVFYALKQSLAEISRSTVFRNLNFLVKQKKIIRIATPSGPTLYELANNKLHATCEVCGKNVTFDLDTNLKNDMNLVLHDVYSKTNIKTTIQGINFIGLCNQCEKNLKRKNRNE